MRVTGVAGMESSRGAAAVAQPAEPSVDGAARTAAVAEGLARLEVAAAAQLAADVVQDAVEAAGAQVARGLVSCHHTQHAQGSHEAGSACLRFG